MDTAIEHATCRMNMVVNAVVVNAVDVIQPQFDLGLRKRRGS